MYKDFNADHVVVSVSGGKDSAALMQWAVDNFPKEKQVNSMLIRLEPNHYEC